MCIFTGVQGSAPDFAVARTRIFARPDGVDQWLAYAMQVAAPSELAMILPLPVPIGSADDAATFLDLSAYPEIFSDLDRCFGEFPLAACASSSPPPQSAARPRLEVHSMGAFEASYVPHQSDFSRLDPRFRLPDEIWRMLPSYRDWGFAVIQLKPGPQDVHPIVLRFPRRWPDRLYFPTVHVHDATVHREADYDHTLYYQGMPRATRRGAASGRSVREESDDVARLYVDFIGTRALIDPDLKLERFGLHGLLPNEDVWLTPASKPG